MPVRDVSLIHGLVMSFIISALSASMSPSIWRYLKVINPSAYPQPLSIGSQILAVGDSIAVLGKHRDGGDFTMTTGVISAVERKPPAHASPLFKLTPWPITEISAVGLSIKKAR